MSSKSFARVAALLLGPAILVAVACGVFSRPSNLWTRPDNVFSEHRALTVGTATLTAGQDCTANGSSACLSGPCLHVLPDRNSGYFCSKKCTRASDCPKTWRCVQTYPGPNAQLCVPPSGWVASVATVP
jgi:hypothetical protein